MNDMCIQVKCKGRVHIISILWQVLPTNMEEWCLGELNYIKTYFNHGLETFAVSACDY